MRSEAMPESPLSQVPCSSSTCRNRVNFTNVQVFYFNRSQGFSCVPTRGGSTLGMVAKHWGFEEFDLDEHEKIRRYERYYLLMKKYRTGKLQLSPAQVKKIQRFLFEAPKRLSTRLRLRPFTGVSLTTDSGISDFLTNSLLDGLPNGVVSPRQLAEDAVDLRDSHIQESSGDDELSSILDCYVLQVLSVKKRRLLLEKSGLKHIDPTERAECQAIRESREVCGCSCLNGVCLPDRCQCSLNGVPCQIDHTDFPCSCSNPNQCVNPMGRTEFNPLRVRAHYIHTQMHLETVNSPVHLGELDETLAESACNHEGEAKRPRFEDRQLSSTNTLLKEDPLGLDDVCLDNSTLNGGCKLCQNDQFVRLLTRNLVFTSSLPPPPLASPSAMLSSSTVFQTEEEAMSAALSFADPLTSNATVISPSALTELTGNHYQPDQSVYPPLFPEVEISPEGTFLDTHQTSQSPTNRAFVDHQHISTVYSSTSDSDEFPTDTFISFNYSTGMPPSANDGVAPSVLPGHLADTLTLLHHCDPAGHQHNSVVVPLDPITSLLPKISPGAVATASTDEGSPRWSCCAFSQAEDHFPVGAQQPYVKGDPGRRLPSVDNPAHIESQYNSVAEEVLA